MQFSIVALLVAATGAVAAPGRNGGGGGGGDRPDRGDRNTITQTMSCNGGAAYCCSPEYSGGGVLSYYQCNKNINSCNIGSAIVCCNNIVQGGNNNHQSQKCSAFGNQKVIYD
ncbi:hypothetical protein BFJ68_g9424 [Fusarium oxysporum]|uniref:Hydrophobin n=1 Tax=Fusarium oxysporum TaxID=5507 RepID=A0A420QV42_FUSOX|nr:hypothetical protein BFJ68_g9424 [Fusarium oxysporum]